MRISSDPDDRGYDKFLTCIAMNQFPTIYINGKYDPTMLVMTADDKRGEVVVFSRDANGRMYLAPGGNVVATETLRGDVRIEWPQ